MAHSALTPVFVGLRTGLHVLVAGLTLLVVIRTLFPVNDRTEFGVDSLSVFLLSGLFLATYAAGGLIGRRRGVLATAWLLALFLEWTAFVWLSPEAAYLVFPLFFLFLHVFGRVWGPIAVVASTVAAIVALGLHGGWTVGGVVGPLVAAGVALLIGFGYQALARESAEREALVRELLETRDQLAETEHASGVLAERARLAREIHDTLAQGLSSIQLLLHAAERADPDRAGIEHIRLARETAAANLADARRFIRELTPPELDGSGLGGALRRLASSQWAARGLRVEVDVSDQVPIPMHVRAALLRIAQGAVANVLQHADARSASISLRAEGDRLVFMIVDDGRGFDARRPLVDQDARSDSFGLRAIHERVDQLGGTLTVDSRPGEGTMLLVDLAMGDLAMGGTAADERATDAHATQATRPEAERA